MSLDNSIHDKFGNLPAQEGNETAAPAKADHPYIKQARDLLAQKVTDPQAYAELVMFAHGHVREELIALLNQSLGNGFAVQAMKAYYGDDKPKPDAAGGAPQQGKPPKVDVAQLRADADFGEAPKANAVADAGPKENTPAPAAAAPEAAPKAEPVAAAEPSKPAAPTAEEPKKDEAPKEAAKPVESKAEFAASSQVTQPKVEQGEPMNPYEEGNETETEEGGADSSAKSANGPMTVTASVLRIRSSPTTASKTNIIGKLKRGKTIQAEGMEGDWVKFTHNGQTAFVHGKYVKAAEQAAETVTQAAPATDKPAIV